MSRDGDRSSDRIRLGLTSLAAAIVFGGSLIASGHSGQSLPSTEVAVPSAASESRSLDRLSVVGIDDPAVSGLRLQDTSARLGETEAPYSTATPAPEEIRLAALDRSDQALPHAGVQSVPALSDTSRWTGTGGPDVFGSPSLSASGMPLARRFQRAFSASGRVKTDDCSSRAESGCVARLPFEWRRNVLQARTLPIKDRIAWINRLVNRRITYRSDMDAHGVPDVWSTPTETMSSNSGDCEDYAVLKMRLLELVGIESSRMHVIVVRSSALRDQHAVLAVRDGEGALILDSLSDALRRDNQISTYVPMFAVNGSGFWIHAKRTESAPAMANGPQPIVR